MKWLMLTLSLILITNQIVTQISYSQSFELINPVSIPDTLNGFPQDGDLTTSPVLKNVSSDTVSYKISIAPINLINGHTFGLCDCFSCYTPEPRYYETTMPCKLPPGATSGVFVHIYLYPNNTEGISVLNIRFFNVDNQEDNAIYQAIFIVGTTDVNETHSFSLSNSDISPNPASDVVILSKLNTDEKALKILEIYHSNGTLMEKYTIGKLNSSYRFNTIEYAQGVYFYRVVTEGKTEKSGKFVISR